MLRSCAARLLFRGMTTEGRNALVATHPTTLYFFARLR